MSIEVKVASFPGLHAQLLSLAVRKAGGRPGRFRHVICAVIRKQMRGAVSPSLRPLKLLPRGLQEWRGLPNEGEELDMNPVSFCRRLLSR